MVGWEPRASPPDIRDAVAHVWAIALGSAGTPLEEQERLLDEDERARARALVSCAARTRFVATRRALRLLLGAYTGVAPDRLRFGLGRRGKPLLVSPRARLEFNVAHTGDLALIAIARGAAVGVDVERRRAMRSPAALAQSHFSANEASAIDALAEGAQSDAFLRCWTRKEAVIKATGEGLHRPLASFEVPLEREVAAQRVALPDPRQAVAVWLYPLDVGPKHLGALAASSALDAVVTLALTDRHP